ncbi:MAG: rhodanese-like domain-containing protein [Pseudomonadota bacterium]
MNSPAAAPAAKKEVPTPDAPPAGVKLASYQDVIDVFHQGGVVYDCRWHYSEYEFEGHIPFAVFVPMNEWSKLDPDFNINEDIWDWSTLPADKNTPIAFYCMGVVCWKSYKLAGEAVKRGYQNVYWYKEGQPGWDARNLPVINRNPTYKPNIDLLKSDRAPASWLTAPATVKEWLDQGAKVKAMDFRDEAAFIAGRLQTASQIPLGQLLSRDGIQLMPKPQEGYKIVLVSEDGQVAMAAGMALASLGYDVKVLSGGMNAWTAAFGNANVVAGPLETNWPGKSGWVGQVVKVKP